MDLLTTYLADRDTPCPGCGYNLRGLTGEGCPECNQEIVLGVSLAEPRLGTLLAAVIALSVGAGAAGVFLFFLVVVSAALGGWANTPAWVVVIPLFVFGVEGGCLLVLARRRGRVWFRSLSGVGRAWVVAGSIGTTIMGVLVFMGAMFSRF